jgi:protein tyrosine/serine phosphatase
MTNNKYILFLLAAFISYKLIAQRASKDPEIEDPDLSRIYNIHLIPDGLNNYRSGQIPKTKLAEFIKKYNIKQIIRFNGDGLDSRKRTSDPTTSIAEEKKICNDNGCKFIQISAHKGYKPDEGYTVSRDEVIKIAKKGNTLIHCLHGADRTGAMVGGYLKMTGKLTDPAKLWKYTTKYNGWRRMIKAGRFFGSGYDKYAETVIPKNKIRELEN